MKHAIYSKVKVIAGTDETADTSLIGKEGTVIAHLPKGDTGNTEEDPLHSVRFENGQTESFWYEELELVN